MCLIIETKKDVVIPEGFFENVFKRNDDGFGFMYVKDGHIETEKYVDDKLETLYERYLATAEYDPVIHMRMKTHGLVDHANTHPYYCNYGIWLMHNGVLNINTKDLPNKSDTWHFIHRYINPFLEWSRNPHKLIRSDKFRNVVEAMIGTTNKLVFGDKNGFVFMNEDEWVKPTEETCGIKGLRVSNSYAWDEKWNVPRPKYSAPMGYGGTYGTVRRYSDVGLTQVDTWLWVDWSGEFWEKDLNQNFWYKSSDDHAQAKKTKIKKKLDKAERRRQKQQKQLELLENINAELVERFKDAVSKDREDEDAISPVCVPGTEPILLTHAPTVTDAEAEDDESAIVELITKDNEEEYLDHLVREYAKYDKHVLSSMVYTDPDDASKVLYKLLHKV